MDLDGGLSGESIGLLRAVLVSGFRTGDEAALTMEEGEGFLVREEVLDISADRGKDSLLSGK